jgi:CheY-like chemotaxis protein
MPDKPLILVVEDSADHVFLLPMACEKAGVKNPIRAVAGGHRAISYLEGSGPYSDWEKFPLPSIILLDLKMPGMDGFAVLRWIRQQPDLRRLRVVILSSSDLIEDVDKAYELGANSFLLKPMGFDKLVKMLQVFRDYWLDIDMPSNISRTPKSLELGRG